MSTTEQRLQELTNIAPTVVKMDIEGFENTFLNISDECFDSVKFYAIEAHSEFLLFFPPASLLDEPLSKLVDCD